jgi:hypothetical protein
MIAIDFEASTLVDGYPVSIGIAASDGRMLYRLIKPHPEWEAMRFSKRTFFFSNPEIRDLSS